MTMTASGGSITRAPRPSSLADVLDLILDKGLVIDAYVRVSAVGIELLTIDARIVIASVDTYLHYAEAVNRLDLVNTETKGITGLFGDDSEGRQNGRSSQAQDEDPDDSDDSDVSDDPDVSDDEDPDRELSPSRGSDEDEDEADDDDREEEREPTRRRGLAARLQERGKWS